MMTLTAALVTRDVARFPVDAEELAFHRLASYFARHRANILAGQLDDADYYTP